VKGAYWTGMEGTPCPLSGLNDSHASAGAPEGNAEVSLDRSRRDETRKKKGKREADANSFRNEVILRCNRCVRCS